MPTLFSTPLRIRGWQSLPFNQLLFWGYFTWQAGRKHPAYSLPQRLGLGLLQMAVFLGSEWGHNLAHAAAARAVDKPMDALEIIAGMPVCLYTPENHRSATPRQHIARALGGPAFNLVLMLFARLARRFTRPGGAAREILDVAVGMNTFLSTWSLLPLPGIDGGPVLKWGLVAAGQAPEQADTGVQRVDLAMSPALGLLARRYFQRRQWVLGSAAAFFGLIALAVGLGWEGQSRKI